MTINRARVIGLTVALLLAPAARPDSCSPLFGELYRPGYHFSPDRFWMNEPNGPIYHNGVYHLFYQHNPFDNDWGNMSWGHATSPDLLHWEHRPVAIPGENDWMAFSGTAVFDANNTSGLGTLQNPPLVAAYTGWNMYSTIQDQRLAYSVDGGATWTKYPGNPVLDISSVEFRDPKVLWYAPTQRWIMVIAHGGQKRVTFWDSTDLIHWTYRSEFTGAGIPGSIGGWEVPDLFELPVDANQANKRWVLVITPSAGSPAGGNGVFYIVGSFNGTTFTRETPASSVLWCDHGRDWDGVLSWENIPASDGRRIWAAIMNSYGTSMPTSPYRGMLSIPREVTLTQRPEGIRMRQAPVEELRTLRGVPTTASNVPVTPTSDPLDALDIAADMIEIIAVFEPGTADTFGLKVRESHSQRTVIGYDANTGSLYVDRSGSGLIAYHPDAGGVHVAPLPLDNGRVKIHVFVDRSSVEVFGNDGLAVISDLIFPSPSSVGVSAYATGGDATLVSLWAYPLSDVWTEVPPVAGSNAVARWTMEPVPQHCCGRNPVTTDTQTDCGEGTALGANPYYERNPSVENLWRFNDLPGAPFVTSPDVPPLCMLANANTGGNASYDAGAIDGVDGVLLCPVDLYGEDFNFTGPFSVEMFFKTSGDQSGAGRMQLLRAGELARRYELTVNDGSGGNVRFTVYNAFSVAAVANIAAVSARNYADGQWHYLLATYDPNAGIDGELSLTIANEDGTSDTAVAALSAAFGALPVRNDGNLLIGRNTEAAGSLARTFKGLIDEVQITDGIVSESERLGLPTEGRVIARWSMDPAPGLPDPAGGANPVTLDVRTDPGQGARTGSNPATAEHDELWSFNGLPGGAYATSTDVPPLSMFANGSSAGAVSYNAGAIAGIDGALFFPQDQYGDEFSFPTGFSVEAFFKTSGDRSNAGRMQIVMQGENAFRFGIVVNEAGPGTARFAIADGLGTFPLVDIGDRNYADGSWHYVLATYDPAAQPDASLSLTILNEDGTIDTATAPVPAGFAGLPPGNDGNLLIGRNTFPVGADPRTFLGLIDEIQLSCGPVPVALRLGALTPPPLCPADLDGDDDTDVFDFAIFAPNFGRDDLPPGTGGDLDADGDCDVFDFALFAPDFGCPSR